MNTECIEWNLLIGSEFGGLSSNVGTWDMPTGPESARAAKLPLIRTHTTKAQASDVSQGRAIQINEQKLNQCVKLGRQSGRNEGGG